MAVDLPCNGFSLSQNVARSGIVSAEGFHYQLLLALAAEVPCSILRIHSRCGSDRGPSFIATLRGLLLPRLERSVRKFSRIRPGGKRIRDALEHRRQLGE